MQIIDTLAKGLSWMARYAGGSVPAISDAQYDEWVSWLSEGQEDAAEHGNWPRLLTKGTLSIVANTATAVLPDDFHKRTGIYTLFVGEGEVDWNEANNDDGQKMYVNKNADGEWVVNFLGFTPTANATGTLWYFRHPGMLEDEDDLFILDGKMCGYYALTEYFRQAGELGSLDDARQEYGNRFEGALTLESLPTPQELASWRPYSQFTNQPNERSFYTRGRRRRR